MFFIVWGWRARTKTLSSGSFHCPNEGGDRSYVLLEARKWFTLFWLPVIPLDVLGEYVECTSCRSTYDPAVLSLPTTVQIEDTVTAALRHVVVKIIRADGNVADEEITTAVEIVGRYTARPYTEADLRRDLVELDTDGSGASELGSLLNDHGRESVLAACLYLAMADGVVDGSELDLIATIGRDLGMSQAHTSGVVAKVTAERQ